MASPVLGGRYELRRRLAQGDSASVYLALDRRGDRQVAVKLLNPGAGADATFGERLRREAPAVAALAAPGIVKVYDWGRAGERHFVVMEYIAGRSLAELIATRGPLGAKVATRVAAEVANALAAAHRAGIVHRNIKPQNVLLSDDAQVKVTDFVMAAPQDLDASGRPAPSGSAAYISPEQARGQPTDGRGDLYALGILLYEMLSGSPPPRGEVRTLGADVPAELGAIVARLVAQAPAHRYQSAEEAVGALQAVHDRLRAQPAPRQDAPAQPEPRSPLPPPPATPRRPVSGPPRRQAPQSGAPPGARPGAPRGVAQRRGGRSAAARRPPGYGTRPRSAGGTGRDGFERIERQRRSGLFFVGFAVLLVVLLIMIVVLVNVLNPDDDTATDPIATIAVPSVYQLTEDVAVRTLESNGFAVVTVRAANAEIPAGHVFEQQPRAGTKLASGSAITLTVSAGASAVPVPNVLGWQAIDAERALRAAGFTANLVQVGSDRPAGEVLQQEPAPLVAHDTGTAVTLNISAGPSAILIPNVAGMDEVDAA